MAVEFHFEPVVEPTCTLKRAAEAHARREEGRARRKTVVAVNGSGRP